MPHCPGNERQPSLPSCSPLNAMIWGLTTDVDDRHSAQDPDLRSGKSDAVRVVHGLSHVLKENVQLFIEFYDRTAFFVEYLVAVLYNVSECHIYPFLIFMSSILAIRLKRHHIIYAVQHTSAFMSA